MESTQSETIKKIADTNRDAVKLKRKIERTNSALEKKFTSLSEEVRDAAQNHFEKNPDAEFSSVTEAPNIPTQEIPVLNEIIAGIGTQDRLGKKSIDHETELKTLSDKRVNEIRMRINSQFDWDYFIKNSQQIQPENESRQGEHTLADIVQYSRHRLITHPNSNWKSELIEAQKTFADFKKNKILKAEADTEISLIPINEIANEVAKATDRCNTFINNINIWRDLFIQTPPEFKTLQDIRRMLDSGIFSHIDIEGQKSIQQVLADIHDKIHAISEYEPAHKTPQLEFTTNVDDAHKEIVQSALRTIPKGILANIDQIQLTDKPRNDKRKRLIKDDNGDTEIVEFDCIKWGEAYSGFDSNAKQVSAKIAVHDTSSGITGTLQHEVGHVFHSMLTEQEMISLGKILGSEYVKTLHMGNGIGEKRIEGAAEMFRVAVATPDVLFAMSEPQFYFMREAILNRCNSDEILRFQNIFDQAEKETSALSKEEKAKKVVDYLYSEMELMIKK